MTAELNVNAAPVAEATEAEATEEATYAVVVGEQTRTHILPDEALLEPLQAAAFRSLCQHLQQHSSQVSNMDLMTLAGFCRNCLAKVRI
jgi:sulfite reductase alpha subunit-like flavoprotein